MAHFTGSSREKSAFRCLACPVMKNVLRTFIYNVPVLLRVLSINLKRGFLFSFLISAAYNALRFFLEWFQRIGLHDKTHNTLPHFMG